MLEKLQQAFKALGQETRLKLFLALARGELCVCQLEHAFNVSQSAISQHLRVLRDAGLVTAERRAQWVFYRASVDELDELLSGLERACDSTWPEIDDLYVAASDFSIEGCPGPTRSS